MTKITCTYCNKDIGIQGMSFHLMNLHNIKFLEYVKQNRNDFPMYRNCDVCGIMIEAIRYNKTATCSKYCLTELRKTWIGVKSPKKGIAHTAEGKKNISIARSAQGNEYRRGFKFSKKSKLQMRNTALINAAKPGYVNGMTGKTHTPEAIEKIFKHKKMNQLEKLVADMLDQNNIPYHFQFFLNYNGICKSYDFKIKDKNILLEVDGDFWHGNPDTKHHFNKLNEVQSNDSLKTQLAIDAGYQIFRFWEKDIKENPLIILKCI